MDSIIEVIINRQASEIYEQNLNISYKRLFILFKVICHEISYHKLTLCVQYFMSTAYCPKLPFKYHEVTNASQLSKNSLTSVN